MFIRLKNEKSNDINVNAANVMTFAPVENGEGTVITFLNGSSTVVLDSTRSIRGYIKKAQQTVETTETEPA